MRGYGPGAHRLLRALASGADWRVESIAAFGGMGSYGNGAAMRVAPLGAYFADDLARAAAEAKLSAEVTHAHPEGIAGAIAVAVAAACAANPALTSERLEQLVLEHTPSSETRDGIVASQQLPRDTPTADAARTLGCGVHTSSQDTVPFVIWCVARHLAGDFATALWDTLSGLGDLDTTCAMVGGILALRSQCDPLPDAWLQARELTVWPASRAKL
jgi:ADP-ribosylglycohydrolase